MADNENSVTDRDRYNRYSEDWRFHHRLIWEIPSVASAILIGILTVSYFYLDLIPRAIALLVGAALILALAHSVRKHRFGADLRTNFLYDISGKDMDRQIRSAEGLEYLKKNEEEEYTKKKQWDSKSKLQKLSFWDRPKKYKKRYLIKISAEVNLIGFMFFAAILISALCLYEAVLTASRIGVLIAEGVPILDIMKNITSFKNLQTKEIGVTLKPS
jgi:hypothetical protein